MHFPLCTHVITNHHRIHSKKTAYDNDNLEITILGYFNANPTLSLKLVEGVSRISRKTKRRILKNINSTSFHFMQSDFQTLVGSFVNLF